MDEINTSRELNDNQNQIKIVKLVSRATGLDINKIHHSSPRKYLSKNAELSQSPRIYMLSNESGLQNPKEITIRAYSPGKFN